MCSGGAVMVVVNACAAVDIIAGQQTDSKLVYTGAMKVICRCGWLYISNVGHFRSTVMLLEVVSSFIVFYVIGLSVLFVCVCTVCLKASLNATL